MPSSSLFVCLIASLVLAALVPGASSSTLSFDVAPKSEECFRHHVLEGNQWPFLFEVIRGGLLDIKLRISGPSGAVLHERLAFFNRDDAENEDEMQATIDSAQSGSYQVCFDNTMSRWTGKVVQVTYLDDEEDNAAGAELDLANVDDLGPVVDSVIQIAEKLDVIAKKQHHMRTREQSHRDHQATLNSRVQYLAILECVTLVGLSVFQVKFIRNWFKETMHLGRV
jgi:hypothetical protein